jgi:hypothetical protein
MNKTSNNYGVVSVDQFNFIRNTTKCPVTKLWAAAWISDSFGNRYNRLIDTNLSPSSFKRARKVLSESGSFSFVAKNSDKDSRKTEYWMVRNLNGSKAYLYKGSEIEAPIRPCILDGDKPESIDVQGLQETGGLSRHSTPKIEAPIRPCIIEVTTENYKAPIRPLEAPIRPCILPESYTEQALQECSLSSHSPLKGNEGTISISAIKETEQENTKTIHPFVEIEPPLFRGEVQDTGLAQEKYEEPVLESFAEEVTTLNAPSPIDNHKEEIQEYETCSGGLSLSDDSLADHLAYLKSLNVQKQPEIESPVLESLVEPSEEMIEPVVELADEFYDLSYQDREYVKHANNLLDQHYEEYKIPGTDKTCLISQENKQGLIDAIKEYYEKYSPDYSSQEFEEYQRNLARNFFTEIRTYGDIAMVMVNDLLEVIKRARKTLITA